MVLLKPGKLPKPCSLTLLTGLDPESPFAYNIRHGSNTQQDFYDCLQYWMENGTLKFGDFLVLDNASVHTGSTLSGALFQLAEQYGVTLVGLPTYSPELNPCELVFARLKASIRSYDALHFEPDSYREVAIPFNQVIVEGLANVTIEELMRMYEHCQNPKYM